MLIQLVAVVSHSSNRTDQVFSEMLTAVAQLRQSDLANSSSRSDSTQLQSELVTVNSQQVTVASKLQQTNLSSNCTNTELGRLLTAVSQLQTTASQLQKDVAELKAATLPKNTTGRPKPYVKISKKLKGGTSQNWASSE